MPLSQKLTQAAPQMLPEAPAHHDAVERVLDRAFGPGRFAKPSERGREFAGFRPDLSRVAVSGPVMLGCCRIYEIGIGDQTALFLGPLAVDPDAQHGGLGHVLVTETVAACREAGFGAIVLMGQPSFFTTLGFSQIPDGRIALPTPTEGRRMHWIALREGALDQLGGAVSPPPGASRA